LLDRAVFPRCAARFPATATPALPAACFWTVSFRAADACAAAARKKGVAALRSPIRWFHHLVNWACWTVGSVRLFVYLSGAFLPFLLSYSSYYLPCHLLHTVVSGSVHAACAFPPSTFCAAAYAPHPSLPHPPAWLPTLRRAGATYAIDGSAGDRLLCLVWNMEWQDGRNAFLGLGGLLFALVGCSG